MLKCFACQSREVRRSRFRLRDWNQLFFLCTPFRCYRCGLRFFDYWWSGIGLGPRIKPKKCKWVLPRFTRDDRHLTPEAGTGVLEKSERADVEYGG